VRPLETDRDMAREEAVAKKIAALKGYQYGRLGTFSPYDVFLLDQKKRLTAIVEIRTRTDRRHDSYAAACIDADKWLILLMADISLRVPGLYAVAYPDDGIYVVRIGAIQGMNFTVVSRGRVDRPGINDVSPVVAVPTRLFERWCDSDGVFE
jgi:hypothetical protein